MSERKRPSVGDRARYLFDRSMSGGTIALIGWLAVISAVVVLIQFVELSSQVGTRADVGAASILELTLLRVPSLIQILLPFVFLFGGMSAFVGLNRRSELVAMRAAGISAWRFILPTAVCAFVLAQRDGQDARCRRNWMLAAWAAAALAVLSAM